MKENVSKKGFTLIELLAVIALISVLLVIVIGQVSQYLESSISDSMKVQEDELVKSAKLLINDYCDYPINSNYGCPFDNYPNNSFTICDNYLISRGYINKITLKNTICDAYVIYNGGNYTPYIKCAQSGSGGTVLYVSTDDGSSYSTVCP